MNGSHPVFNNVSIIQLLQEEQSAVLRLALEAEDERHRPQLLRSAIEVTLLPVEAVDAEVEDEEGVVGVALAGVDVGVGQHPAVGGHTAVIICDDQEKTDG